MASVYDVAKYIIEKDGAMATSRLHYLLYYAQAWSLAFDKKALFVEEIEANTHGVLISELFALHVNKHYIQTIQKGNVE